MPCALRGVEIEYANPPPRMFSILSIDVYSFAARRREAAAEGFNLRGGQVVKNEYSQTR